MNSIGIGDASDYDTNLFTDWALARARGCKFGIVRAATTGAVINGKPTMRADRMIQINASRMATASVKRLSYAWFDPRVTKVSVGDQATTFLGAINLIGPGELGPAIDIEDAPSAGIYSFIGIGKYIKQWLDVVEAELKVKPRIYTNLDYVGKYLFNYSIQEPWLNDYELIIANWNIPAPHVPQPYAPTAWAAWQYRANAPGKYYGFFRDATLKTGFETCLAVWNGEL